MPSFQLDHAFDATNLTLLDSNQTQTVSNAVTGYVCDDYRKNVTCPAAPGNPDIAGLGVVVSFMVILLLPVALAAVAAVSSFLQYCYMHVRAIAASRISEGNDIVPVWPERLARCLARPAALPSTNERTLKRLTNYTLSMMLGLSDQVLLFGVVFIVLQAIGLARGTTNILDFRTLAVMVILCAETQIVCLYSLQPLLTGLDLPMLTKLQWRYLERNERKAFEKIVHSPQKFRKDLVSRICNTFRGLSSEARQMIDRVPFTATDRTSSGRLTMRVRAAGHILLLATLPIQLLAITPSSLIDPDGGCPARCLFSHYGPAFILSTYTIEMNATVAFVFFVYLGQVIQFLRPRTMRRLSLIIRLLFYRISQGWAEALQYTMFTAGLAFSKHPKVGLLITAYGVFSICMLGTMSYLTVQYRLFFIFATLVLTDVASALPWMGLVAAVQALQGVVLQINYLYTGPVVAALASSNSPGSGGGGLWTDGQILPLLMLAGTLVVVLQNASGRDVSNTRPQGHEATAVIKLPSHPAFLTGDKSMDVKIEAFVARMSTWELGLVPAVFRYFFHRLFATTPIPGDTWSHKGLRHLGLLQDPAELDTNGTFEDQAISITQDARRQLVKDVMESNGHNWFQKIGLVGLSDGTAYDVDELLTPELSDALGRLGGMRICLRDHDLLLDHPLNLMFTVLEYLAVGMAAWKYDKRRATATANVKNNNNDSQAPSSSDGTTDGAPTGSVHAVPISNPE